MKLIRLLNISHESGYCFISILEGVSYVGEGVGLSRKSSLKIFENGRELKPGSSSHESIRKNGKGAHSHWQGNLYFSASDNSDATKNGREYVCVVAESDEEEQECFKDIAAAAATNPDILQVILESSISSQGAELHSAYSLRCLLSIATCQGIGFDGLTCLEIGASPTNGLAISLGLLGAKKIILNNIAPIVTNISVSFAKNIALLTGLIAPIKRTLNQLVDVAHDGRTCQLKTEIYTVLGGVDAVDLPKRVSGVDLIFSFSVLEHIRHLPEVMRALHNLSTPTTISMHVVDTRDHTDFSMPLKFLSLNEEEFNSKYSEDHNRWRWPDYLNIFHESGWDVIAERYVGLLPVTNNNGTDMYAVASLGPERLFHDSPSGLEQIVTSDEIGKLRPEFRCFSPEELSVLVFLAILRPRQQF